VEQVMDNTDILEDIHACQSVKVLYQNKKGA
jgi:hypothetical protein